MIGFKKESKAITDKIVAEVINRTQYARSLNVISILKGELKLTEERVDVVIDKAKKYVSVIEKYLDS